jgi:uncharacterized protein (TIGR04255 family)
MNPRDSLICRSVLTGPHPSYPNPTIVQVTCEIAFASEADVKLSASSLYRIFSEEFPEIQPIQMSLQVVVGGQLQPVQDPAVSANAGAFRFATEDGKRFVQLSKTNFVYQTNERYPGWKDFRDKLLQLWSASTAHVKPSTIVKIGIRYINRIVKTEAHPFPKDWLYSTADLPAAIIASQEHFLGRIESSPAPSHLRLVTVAAEPAGPEWPLGSIIMDVDRISMERFEASNAAISEKLDILHEDVWQSFDSATAPALKAYLNGHAE